MTKAPAFPAWMGALPRSIPRVPGLPIIGSLLEFRNRRLLMQREVPQRYGPIAALQIGLFGAVMVSSPELAHQVLVEHPDAFVKSQGLSVFARPLLGDGLLTSERDFHKRQRRMMSPLFMHKRIAGFAPEMVARADKTQASLRDGETVDVSAEMMRLTLEIVGKTLFDAEVGDEAQEIGDALEAAMRFVLDAVGSVIPVPPIIPTPRNRRNRASIARLDATIYRLIAERRASIASSAERADARGDLLSMLLSARDEEAREGVSEAERRMTDRQVRDEAMTLFLAGHETTANALSWAFYLLALNPNAQKKLSRQLDDVLGGRAPTHADLPRLPFALGVIKETMRLYPPAYIIGRSLTRPLDLGGHRLPRGTVVLLNIFGQHRLPAIFDDPECFDPDRFETSREKALPRYAYLPFGAGPRVCIGNHFALMEAQLALATIARNITFEAPPGFRVEADPLITLRPRDAMRMRVRRRVTA